MCANGYIFVYIELMLYFVHISVKCVYAINIRYNYSRRRVEGQLKAKFNKNKRL